MRFLSLLRSHLAPAERQKVLSVDDDSSMLAGSTPQDLTRMLESVDVLVLLITPEYYGSAEFRDIVAPLAKNRCATSDGLVVGVFPVAFDTAGELDWLPVMPEYSKTQGRPRPSRAETIIADAARDLLAKLDVQDGEKATPRYDCGEHREIALELRRAYRIAELRHRNPRAVTDVDALHRVLRHNGEVVAGDFVGDGRFGLLYRRRYHGPLEEWAAFDRRSRTAVRTFILTARTRAALPPEELDLDRLASATSAFHRAEPSSLLEPLRHERGLGFFLVAEATP